MALFHQLSTYKSVEASIDREKERILVLACKREDERTLDLSRALCEVGLAHLETSDRRVKLALELLGRPINDLAKTDALAWILLFKHIDNNLENSILSYDSKNRLDSVKYKMRNEPRYISVEVNEDETCDWELLLLIKALLDGYSFIEIIGKHFKVLTPRGIHCKVGLNFKPDTGLLMTSCDCQLGLQGKNCLHKVTVRQVEKRRQLFLKYKLLHQID
jgi:hypothetical protein